MLPSVYKIQEKEISVISCLEIKAGYYIYVCSVTFWAFPSRETETVSNLRISHVSKDHS